jgi:2-keto-4-pentenoate hydratase/2-oxohepta-3-ene-1,7-dioic acid hydratase in catechol pathway
VRIAAFTPPGSEAARRGGVVVGTGEDARVHPLPAGTDVLALLDQRPTQAEVLRRCEPAVALADVRLASPVEPTNVRDFLTFEQHVAGMRKSIDGAPGVPAQWYEAPVFYFSNPYSVLGPADDVPMAPGSTLLDYELEVAAVIGRAGRDLDARQAREHIVGYTIFNDWSARDLQKAEMQVGLGPSKGKDTSSTLGPWLVTADELEPYRDADGFLDLELTAEVNGEQLGHDRLSHMGWTFEDMVVYASRGTWVRPGDVLGSGTCGNGGCLAELWGRHGEQTPPPLQPGDVVELTVEGIGSLRSTVVAGVAPVPVPTARHRLADRQLSQGPRA